MSTGGLSPAQTIPIGPGVQLPFAARIMADTGLTTIGVGLITEPAQAEAATAFLYDPRWPWHAAATLGAEVDAPRQYWRCQPAGVPKLLHQGRYPATAPAGSSWAEAGVRAAVSS